MGRKSARKIADEILARAAAGEKLPTENEVRDAYGTNSNTANKVMTIVRTTLEVEKRMRAEQAAAPTTSLEHAPKSWKEEYERHRKRLDREFDLRVEKEVRRILHDSILPYWGERVEQAEAILKQHRGPLTEAEYKMILGCLHPDRARPGQETRFQEAFNLFLTKRADLTFTPPKASPGALPSAADLIRRRRAS